MNQRVLKLLIGSILGIFLGVGYLAFRLSDLLTEVSPPKIEYNLSYHKKGFFKEVFKGCNWFGYKRQIKEACVANNSTTRNFAVQVAGESQGEYNLGQVCDLFDYYRENWKYVNDPTGAEYISPAHESIRNNFNGDCDDFAVLMCTSVISIGGEARINMATNARSGHAFTEVNLGITSFKLISEYLVWRYNGVDEIHYRKDQQGNLWLNLDWFASNPGGKYFDFNRNTIYYPIQQFCESFD